MHLRSTGQQLRPIREDDSVLVPMPSRDVLGKRTGFCLLVFSTTLFAVALFSRVPFHADCNYDNTNSKLEAAPPSGLEFMKGKMVLLVSHELSLSGGPLLLMELATLLTRCDVSVYWTTNQKEVVGTEMFQALENRLKINGVQILPARGPETVKVALDADLIVLNTAVTGKWLETVLKVQSMKALILPKILWWIHEMRGHYFSLDFVQHLPEVGGAMIDSHATAAYWQNRTHERLGIKMPQTFVVHLGNSKQFMQAAENALSKELLRQFVRESLGIRNEDFVFSAINSVSRGKGQDLLLKSFTQFLHVVRANHTDQLQKCSVHLVIVGSDLHGQPKFEAELRSFVEKERLENVAHFINKTMSIIPYLAASDVLVQNSQARGECFGRISIEAMAFQLPVLGTAAGGTVEIVHNGVTGFLHPVGKEGIPVLSSNMLQIFLDKNLRSKMGKQSYERVKKNFLEHHMSHKIGLVFKNILDRPAQN